jgi:release factor glutamine methyltransferase
MQKTLAQALVRSCRAIDKVDAQMLLQHVLNVNQAYLLTHPDQLLTCQQEEAFAQLVTQRVDGTPIAYLTGEREFYSLKFSVTEAVLIPRPETELLIDLALARIPTHKACRILDLGTGSGAIAITIAKHRPESHVVAVDCSAAALFVARLNAQNLVVSNIHIVQGNWYDELAQEKFDLIVSNPPYVAEHDPHLQQGDLRFEPLQALATGDDGLACIKHIIINANKYLADEAWLLLEHGYDQAAACRQLLIENGFSQLFSHNDLAGIIRVSGGRFLEGSAN